MVTFAQAQERAEEWINGELPAYQHREVRVREFGLGFVVWAEDREGGVRSGGGTQRLVIARDGGEATLWPGLPVGEVIRRYEEEYGGSAGAPAPAAPEKPKRIDLHQTSFLITPPEWLQEAANRRGDEADADTDGAGPQDAAPAAASEDAVPRDAVPPRDAEPEDAPPADAERADGAWPTPSHGTAAGVDDGSVPLPVTVLEAPAARGPVAADADLPTALMDGGSQLPPTAVEGALRPAPATPVPTPPQASAPVAPPQGATPPPFAPPAPTPPPPVGATPPPASPPPVTATPPSGAADIADAATAKAPPPRRPAPPAGAATPPPPGPPAPPGGTGGIGYVPTQLVSQVGPEPTPAPGPPAPPGPPGPPSPPNQVHHAATMLAGPNPLGPGAPPPPGATPPPPGPPGVPASGGVPRPNSGPPAPPGPPPPVGGPGAPAGYGYPQQSGVPTVGPGYQAVLRYRAPDGSEAQIIRRSAPGTPHPEWQIFHELRAMNIPSDQVLGLHTELESCDLPGGYCARMIREQWPQARITSIAPYGRDHAGRQDGMRQLITHQGELHQVADGPARPAPVRVPLPQVQPAPPVPPQGVAQELLNAFGPQGILRFDQRAVSRQGVPDVVAATLVYAGLPGDFNPFFWAQPAQPVIPTLAELAAQRQVRAAADASSYLVVGSDFGRAICVQYGTANIVAVPVEAGPGGAPTTPQFVNTGLPEFLRCLALLGQMWRLRYGLTPEQAGRWTADFQGYLAALDPAALASPESWWSVLLEQMWDGLL
ncbi:SUKH-4 family immunity protein [Streptomyces sp. NPDC006798]|uniref:SUKH-4 family immunity protein n=1 Tax=Streptomyces sp. NPDC006798 TaxID=3155462 RepID=UPI0033F05973